MEILKDSSHNFIFLGASKEEFIGKNIYGYVSGLLEDEFIDYLIAKSQGILFPSYLRQKFMFKLISKNKEIFFKD